MTSRPLGKYLSIWPRHVPLSLFLLFFCCHSGPSVCLSNKPRSSPPQNLHTRGSPASNALPSHVPVTGPLSPCRFEVKITFSKRLLHPPRVNVFRAPNHPSQRDNLCCFFFLEPLPSSDIIMFNYFVPSFAICPHDWKNQEG